MYTFLLSVYAKKEVKSLRQRVGMYLALEDAVKLFSKAVVPIYTLPIETSLSRLKTVSKSLLFDCSLVCLTHWGWDAIQAPPPAPGSGWQETRVRENERRQGEAQKVCPAVPWSGLCTFTTGRLGLIPECGTETHQTTWRGQK